MKPISELETTLISEGTELNGDFKFSTVTRIHGIIKGTVVGPVGSTIIVCETGVIEGKIFADTLIVDGFIRGQIVAESKVKVSALGRIIGQVQTPNLEVKFGAHIEAKFNMENLDSKVFTDSNILSPSL